MSYHANSEERGRLTAGLRELADFLDQNPQVPAPRAGRSARVPGGRQRRRDVRRGRRHRRADRRDGQRRRQPGAATTAHRATSARSSTAPSPSRTAPATTDEEGRVAMLLHLILGSAALLAAPFAVGLLLTIVGIQRGDRGKRLTGRPPAAPRRSPGGMLTGSRGCDARDDAGEADEPDHRPFRRRGRLRPPLPRARLRQVPRPVPLDAPQGLAVPQVPEPPARDRKR